MTIRHYKHTIVLSQEEADEMQAILDVREGHATDYDRDGVIQVYSETFDIPAGLFAIDVKVCNGDTPYVDTVLFKGMIDEEKGNHQPIYYYEIDVLEVDDVLLGTYTFDLEEHDVILELELTVED